MHGGLKPVAEVRAIHIEAAVPYYRDRRIKPGDHGERVQIIGRALRATGNPDPPGISSG
jgi:hypothetical protein